MGTAARYNNRKSIKRAHLLHLLIVNNPLKHTTHLLNQSFGRLPIAHKLSFIMVCLLVLSLSTLWLIVNNHLSTLLEEQTDIFGQTIAQQTARSAAELILAEDLLSLNVIVTQVNQAPNILHARIRNAEEEILAESNSFLKLTTNTTALPKSIAVYSAPITFQDVRAGYADIIIDKKSIRQAVENSLYWMSVATVVLLLLCILLSLVLSSHIIGPIKRLTQALIMINGGNWDYRIKEKRSDELGILIDSFNAMAGGLKERQQIKATFNRYVDPSVAYKLLKNPESPVLPLQYVNASILFIDIVGFTSLCEKIRPSQIANLLNLYYECIQKACAEFGGIVDKFIGDGALIIFGAANQDKEHALHALCAGHLLLNVARCIGPSLLQSNQTALHFRISIHSGAMLAGSLGGTDRLQYTVIGDTVNLASRLCHQAPIDKLVVSENCKQLIDKTYHSLFTSLGQWNVKGKQKNIAAFSLDRLMPPYQQIVEQKSKTLQNQLNLTTQH